jgi:hypothetical protein
MDDSQRDPRTDLGDRLQAFFAEFSGTASLARALQDPNVRAYVEALTSGESLPWPRPCHCLCVAAHPDDKGTCDMEAVTTRHFETELLGPVDVPLCAPCAVAQGIAELEAQ